MASITWSTTLASGDYMGTAWQSCALSSDGSTLPAGASITSVVYDVTAYAAAYTTGTSHTFNLYAVAIENGPYTTTPYSSSGAATLTATIGAQTTSSTTSEATGTTGSFQGGSYCVWRYGSSRTYVKLNGCGFSSNITASAPFGSSVINTKLRLNSSMSATTYITAISVTVTYTEGGGSAEPTLEWDQAVPTCTKNDDGTITLSWSEAIGKNGSSDAVVGYFLYSSVDMEDWNLERLYRVNRATIAAPTCDTYYYVMAIYGSLGLESAVFKYEVSSSPKLEWNATLTASQEGNMVKLTWDAAPTYSGGSGECLYSVSNGKTWVVQDLPVSTRSYTLEPTAYGERTSYAVRASYAGLFAYKAVTFTASAPKLTWDQAAPICVKNDDGTITLVWSEAVGEYGSSDTIVAYFLYSSVDMEVWEYEGMYRVNHATITAPTCDTYYYVTAIYGSLGLDSNQVKYEASALPTLAWDQAAPTVTEIDDGTIMLEWSKAVGEHGPSGSAVSYELYTAASSSDEGTLIGTYTSEIAVIDVPEDACYYYVVAIYCTQSLTSDRQYYSQARTVKRWNGTEWEECIVCCYDGSAWIECIPYRYNGESWDLLG